MESLRSGAEGNAVGTAAHSSSRRCKFDHIMRLLESSCPSIQLHKKEFEEEFNKLNHTPDHPPYASMIQRAITKLNEREGSSEETISKFIEAEFLDLPMAHTSQLTRHLQKLVAKGEIVCTSRNCYILSFENSDLLHKLKKEQKHLRRFGQGRKKRRQHKVKGVKSQKEQKESQELNHVNGKIFEAINKMNQTEEREIESIGKQTELGHAELIEEQNKVEELRLKAIEEQVEAEQDNEGNEEHDQMQEQQNQEVNELNSQQNLVLRQTIELPVGEKNQAEESNLAENHNEVTEVEHQKELENKVIEEQNSEKLEEKNQTNKQERKAREEQVQLSEIHIEAMVGQIDQQAQHFEVSEEEKSLQEQQMEVCCQIIDLSNTLMHFIKKEKENEATMSSQNMDLFGSSRLTKEEFMELLKKTYKIQGRLIDIISSFNMEMSENDISNPASRRQQELLAEHLQQTRNLGKGQPQPEQQWEVCGQSITTPSENDVPADSIHLEQNTQNDEDPNPGRHAGDKTTLDELLLKQNRQIKLKDQQEATKSQHMSKVVSLDGPCYSTHDKNENKQMVIQRGGKVLEDNSRTAQEKIKFSRHGNMSMPETEKSYLVQFIDKQLQNLGHSSPERLPKFQVVTSSLNVLQESSLEHQQQTNYKNETEGPEYKQPGNPIHGSHVEPKQTGKEHQIQTREQMLEQKLQSQSRPFSENQSEFELAADTSFAKECEQPKELQNQHQRRQLQPRVPRPSEGDPVVSSVEDDRNLTLASLKSEMKQKLLPSTLKRPREASPTTVVEISHSRDQQKKHQSEHKWHKYHPIVDTAITSQQQVRQLRPRSKGPSRSELVSVQLQQQEQKKSKAKGRGRPKLKSNVDTATRKMPNLCQHHEQQQPQHRDRGRPPKQKTYADASLEGSLPLDHHNHNEKQPSYRGRGRPPKSKLAAASEQS